MLFPKECQRRIGNLLISSEIRCRYNNGSQASMVLKYALLLCLMAFSQTRILSLIPLTGGAATWGVEYNNSFTLAAEQINSSTTEDNEKVMIYTEDTKCNPNVAVSVLRSGIAKYSPDFIIGGICSGDVLAQAKIVNQAKIPFIVSGASADEIRDSGEFIFRIIPSDTAVARFGANYLISAGCKNVFLISEKTSYAQGMKNLLRNSMANQVTLTLEDYLSGERDFSSIIMKLKRTNPDCIIFNGQTPSSNGLLIGRLGQQFTNLNAKRFVFYSAGNQDLIEASKGHHLGVFDISVMLSDDNKRVEKFMQDYRNRFGRLPDLPFYAVSAYDSVMLVHDLVKKSKMKKVSPFEVLNKDYSFEGIRGLYEFDAYGELEPGVLKFKVTKFTENGSETVYTTR